MVAGLPWQPFKFLCHRKGGVRYRINRWFESYRIPAEKIDEFESFALSTGLKIEVRYRYEKGSRWKKLDRIFFYDGDKRSEKNTMAEVLDRENGWYEVVILDEKLNRAWKASGGNNK